MKKNSVAEPGAHPHKREGQQTYRLAKAGNQQRKKALEKCSTKVDKLPALQWKSFNPLAVLFYDHASSIKQSEHSLDAPHLLNSGSRSEFFLNALYNRQEPLKLSLHGEKLSTEGNCFLQPLFSFLSPGGIRSMPEWQRNVYMLKKEYGGQDHRSLFSHWCYKQHASLFMLHKWQVWDPWHYLPEKHFNQEWAVSEQSKDFYQSMALPAAA